MRASRYRCSVRTRRQVSVSRWHPLLTGALQLALVLPLGLFVVPAPAGASVPPTPVLQDDGEDLTLKAAEGLAEQLIRVPSNDRRTEILEEMIVLADGHTPAAFALRDALIEIWNKANRRLGAKQPLRSFKKLIATRSQLDGLRASTLALIRDKGRYPYPCAAPEASPEAVKAFKKTQAEIDRSVEMMRGLWRSGSPVKVPALMHGHLDLAMWAVRAKKRAGKVLGLNVEFPAPDLPSWVYGLPLRGEVKGDLVTLAVLGLTMEEQKALEKNRAVRALNRRLREETLLTAKNRFQRDRIKDEFSQVSHTNDYRELFGLHALAWDVRLFQATRQHADYLWESGEFTHFQPEAEFSTFMARAFRAGYTEKVYENCHKGSNDPFDAHDVLCHSSEHHRTILLENVHEIATARSGLVWVQNYGLDTGFRSAIQWGAWRD